MSVAASAIKHFRATLRFDAIPSIKFETRVREFDKIREIIANADNGITRVASVEGRQVRERALNLLEKLRGLSISAHLARVNTAVESVSNLLPSASPDTVRDWKSAYERAKQGMEADADRRVEDLLAEGTEAGEEQHNASYTRTLAWASRAPAKDLELFRDAAVKGETAINALLEHVRDCVSAGEGMASLTELRNIGKSIRALIKEAESESA